MVPQTKCVRYYMVFQRAMAVLKRVLATERRATDAHELPGAWGDVLHLPDQL
jgi:hypothetical protein